MLRRLLVGAGVALASFLLLILAGLGWLLYQPGGGSWNAFETFMWAWRRDPAHAAIYARAYQALLTVSDGDAQHYVVHTAAADLARWAGNEQAAAGQESRAAAHRLR